MLVRIRWFLLGAAAALGGGAMAVGRVVRLRERLTPEAVGRAAARSAGDALDRLAEAVEGGTAR